MLKHLCLAMADEPIANNGVHVNDLLRFPNVFDVSIESDLHSTHVELVKVIEPLNLITNVDIILPSTLS